MKRLIGTLLLAVALTQGCDRRKVAPPRAPEPKHILATVYPLAEVAKEIGGDRVTVEWFIESGQPLTELPATPERRNAARTADIVISRGASETWMLGGADEAYGAQRIIRLTTFPAAASASPQSYLWLDPQVVRELANELVKRLSSIDAAGESQYQANAKRFLDQLDAICDDARKKLATMPEKNFVCTSAGFSAFVLRFGVVEALAPTDPTMMLSDDRLRSIRAVARGVRAKAVFVPDDLPAGVMRDLSSKIGVPVLTLDPLGTSAPAGRNTYLKLLRYNLDQVIAGVGG
jgi:ABC-type Zn uptake system ZnuABC Zn-binding protein ZnuA